MRKMIAALLGFVLIAVTTESFAETWAQACARSDANETAADTQRATAIAKGNTMDLAKEIAEDRPRPAPNWTVCENDNYEMNLGCGDAEAEDGDDSFGEAVSYYTSAEASWALAWVQYPLNQSLAAETMGEAADSFDDARSRYAGAGSAYGRAHWFYNDICNEICAPKFAPAGCAYDSDPDCMCGEQ